MRRHSTPIDSPMTLTGRQITGHGIRSTAVTPTVTGEPGDESRAGCNARTLSAGRHRTAKWLSG